MRLPGTVDAYKLRGLALRQLTFADKAQMMRMQETVLSALPDPAWYFPSEEWEFDEWLNGREALGYFAGNELAGFAVASPASARGERSYAGKLGDPVEDTFDFHDVMVLPAYRGRGLHTMFLKLFEEMARALDGRAIYATVDPGNGASWRNFEKAGYACVAEKTAYDGRMRRYYRLTLL